MLSISSMSFLNIYPSLPLKFHFITSTPSSCNLFSFSHLPFFPILSYPLLYFSLFLLSSLIFGTSQFLLCWLFPLYLVNPSLPYLSFPLDSSFLHLIIIVSFLFFTSLRERCRSESHLYDTSVYQQVNMRWGKVLEKVPCSPHSYVLPSNVHCSLVSIRTNCIRTYKYCPTVSHPVLSTPWL